MQQHDQIEAEAQPRPLSGCSHTYLDIEQVGHEVLVLGDLGHRLALPVAHPCHDGKCRPMGSPHTRSMDPRPQPLSPIQVTTP